MTQLSLRNPIAIAMACVAVIVFAAVVTPRMAVDTFPDLTPPVLVVGTLAPGLGAKDVEKTLNWRFEKYVSATPGVEHVESISRNNLSIVYVWLQWGTDLNAAQTLVQQQVQFAMSAVPKSLGVLPPFVLQFDPANAPVIQIAIYGGGLTGPQLYDYAQNEIEPLLEGVPGVASASVNGGRQRQIAELEEKLAHDPRAAGFPCRFVGQVDLMRTTFSGLGLAVGLAIMVVFMIMASQFKSLKMPFIMLFTIPCTLVGIVLALMAGGQGFSVTALMGILMVVGIAVSNGILLIDHARVRLEDGLSPLEAILDAARTRFVPIAMTSLATVIGLVPTALALDRGAAANQPLALAVVGGLTSSTLLSLYVVPVIFLALVRSKPAR